MDLEAVEKSCWQEMVPRAMIFSDSVHFPIMHRPWITELSSRIFATSGLNVAGSGFVRQPHFLGVGELICFVEVKINGILLFEVQWRGKRCEEVFRGTRMEDMLATEAEIVAVEKRV